MVDQLGSGPFPIGGGGVARIDRIARPAAVATTARPATGGGEAVPAPALGGLAKELAAEPPVNHDRVAMIKRAIAEGRFPLSPATIADRLIALRLNWSGNE
jgi:negative regulator of flagellin synthesis FlgM